MIFKGVCTALVTPLTEDGDRVNFDEFRKIIDEQISGGVDSLVFLGTTGEASTFTREEKIEIVKFAVAYVNNRVPVIVGAGSNNTEEAVKNSLIYQNLGVNGLLIVTPYYNKTTQKGLVAHYTKIADSVCIPIILYNVPGRTGINMMPSTVAMLAKHKNIIAIKEASGNIVQMQEILRLTKNEDFCLYSGDDALIVPVLAIGGMGVISVASNILPKQVCNICKEFFTGNILGSMDIAFKLLPIIQALFIEVNPIPVKYAMRYLGYNVGKMRLPLQIDMEDKNKQILENEIKNLKQLNY